MLETSTFTQHYGKASLIDRLQAALKADGLDEKPLSPADLAPLDQFHSRGLAATVELAKTLELDRSTRVLDIGSGLGGPSRYLAATYGCTVHGIDLSPSFVDAAHFLADRCGLTDKVTYQQGNALSLPFASATFDVAWTQHVAMNIADRASLYSEAFRVLRSGGHFAIYDVIAASDTPPLHYPVPWASSPEMSFLVTADDMRTVLIERGFQLASWTDCTEAGVAWFMERKRALTAPASSALGLHLVMGSDFGVMTNNLVRNLREGRAALIHAVLEKP